jgi:hypothetical protein
MKIHALEKFITSGSQSFPIYIGFMTAADLLLVAEVPNFKKTTPNQDIASNVLTPPVKEWQRPLIEEKKEKIIKTFNGTGEFMPNPVLVAERGIGAPPDIKIDDLKAVGGISTGIKIIKIGTNSDQPHPLWIIDGQHRISGLGDPRCVQKDNIIPVVFLLNNGTSSYNGRNLAKIFAQVTTEATPLATLHKEWLTFAFELDTYSNGNPAHKAMEAVANLCKMPHIPGTQKINGFHDDIRFNDELVSTPKYLGHQYDCKDLSALVATYYYSEVAKHGHLDPKNLATQISIAFSVLKTCVSAPHDSTVFFGSGNYCHKIMIDAFLVGVLVYLRGYDGSPPEADWQALLKKLNFHLTDWNFQQHVISNSRWVDKSKALAFDVFSYIFEEAKLPANVSNIWDYLSGDQLFINLEFKHTNAAGKVIKRDPKSEIYKRADKKTFAMAGRKYFRVASLSKNAKHIELFDNKSSPVDPVKFKTTGEYMRPPKIDPSNKSQDPLVLTIRCTLYGGIEERITVTLAGWI